MGSGPDVEPDTDIVGVVENISYFRTLEEQLDRSLNTERLLAALSTSFGTVTQRTREIGIRMAMGATRFSMIWLVLGDALNPTNALRLE